MSKAEVGLCEMDEQYEKRNKQKEDRMFLNGIKDTRLFCLMSEERHCGYSEP